MTKAEMKEIVRKGIAKLNAYYEAENYLDKHEDKMDKDSYYAVKIKFQRDESRIDGMIHAFEMVANYDLISYDEVQNLIDERRLKALKAIVDDRIK